MNLTDLVRRGDTAGVAVALADFTPEQRRAGIPALRELRKEFRDTWSGSADAWTALLIAGAGCHTAPSAAAEWLGSPAFEDRAGWRNPLVVAVVDAQPAAWREEVVARLAVRRAPGWGWSEHFPLLEHLVRTTGCPVPTADPFVTQWMRERARPEPRARAFGALPPGPDLHARLAADPFTPVLAPRLFEVDDAAAELEGPWVARDDTERWPGVLARLAADGVLDRADLVDRCLARLLRGGRPADQRAFLAVLKALAPTGDEYVAHVRTLLGMLDGVSTAAGHAQEVLAALDAAGRLDAEAVAEASRTVLFRPEKKLVRAQLAWLGRAARTAPDRAGPVVLAAAGAFGHPDRALQESALKVVARHLPAAGTGVLAELRAAAEQLDPAHHRRAAELFGAEVRVEAYTEQLPAVPRPRPVPPPVAGAAELAEELAAVLAGDTDPVVWERVLDGLVRHAWLDRAGLTEALEPVFRLGTRQDLGLVAEAAAGRTTAGQAHELVRARHHGPLRFNWTTSFDAQIAARLEEAVLRLVLRPLPYLLATPTLSTGAIDAGVLVERLAGYEREGVDAGPVDLGQALLRVTPTADPAVLAAAGRLRSNPGGRLADWLRTGGLPHQESVLLGPSTGRGPTGRRQSPNRRLVEQAGAAVGAVLPPDAERLVGPVHSQLSLRGTWWTPPALPRWAAIMPGHREETAARLLDRFAGCADLDERGGAALLPVLAEADGPAGLALHLAVGYGLGARHREDRTAAVDALLVLAARGDLDAALLGREAGELVRLGAVKPNRLADALRSAADTGAYGTVWSVLAAALPPVLTEVPPRGAGELVAVAADCARRVGARGPIPAVTAFAGRAGASQAVREAVALREVLAG
ncbi:DUF6493 family protein [Kitasatospora sp. NBC_01539]|uniref:DUF6493 family protein n=1 Tax=Kitasatospora sp. NBC_01539 TaxID=2903577 RepID=UPI0038601F21